MKHPKETSLVPEIKIDNPKNKKGFDLSDHFPIVINGLGLKIISFNIQFIHSLLGGAEGKKTSTEKKQAINDIADYFSQKDADVCCVQELFDNEANTLMEAAMLKKGYVATARVGSKDVSVLNGGARTFVKKNLSKELKEDEHVYTYKIDSLIGADALVNKGILHTSLNKEGTKYHVFNTHLQAYYPNRDHYAEITLAQCVEIKKFIEEQQARGLIGSNDKIILCGDFNIPKPNTGDKEANFLYTKLTHLMGAQFTFLDYKQNTSGPQYTLSLENTYNTKLTKSNDNDVNLDLGILYNPDTTHTGNTELSNIFCEIQLAISKYVDNHATFISKWLLTKEQTVVLEQFNSQVKQLIERADEFQAQGKNPIADSKWLRLSLKLLEGPSEYKQDSTLTKSITINFFGNSIKKPNVEKNTNADKTDLNTFNKNK